MRKLHLQLLEFIRHTLLEDVTRRVRENIMKMASVPAPGIKAARGNPNLPETEEEFDAQLKYLETLSPDKANSGYVQFLALSLYNGEWRHEDEPLMRELLSKFAKYKSDPYFINSNKGDITFYKNRKQLADTITQFEGAKAHSGSTAEEHAEIQQIGGAHVILEDGDWKLWRVPKGSAAHNKRAAYLLASNARHGTEWCVGWEAPRQAITSYLEQGDFFVFQKNGISQYAVSTQNNEQLSLWSPSDTELFNSKNYSNDDGSSKVSNIFKSVASYLSKFGVDPGSVFPSLSVLPEDIRHLINKAKQIPEGSVFSLIPSYLLEDTKEEDKNTIFRMIHAIPVSQLIADINEASESYDEKILAVAEAILRYLVDPHKGKKLSEAEMEDFTISSFFKYLEAHARAHDRNMSKEIKNFILSHLE